MSVRITQRTMYGSMVDQMQKNLAAYMESNEQGSTQKKINRPSDDPAGTYRVLMSRDEINATTQYQSNADTATGWLKLADSILGSRVSELFQELEQLAQQASNTEMTAENRKQIGFRVKEIFGSLLNLSNTEFEGKSIFAGHKYDVNAFEQGLALTTWDKDWQSVTDANGVEWKPPQYAIEGASESSMMIQFTSDGEVGADALTYRWSKDGGDTWNDAVLAAGDSTLVADGVRVTLPPKSVNNGTVPPTVTGLTVKAAATELGPGAENGTLLYIRPTAVYQGDDKDPPPEMTIMGGQPGLASQASGVFKKNVLVRMDTAADLNSAGNDFTYSYSSDGGSTWVTAQGQTTGGGTLRLPLPGGYMDLDANGAAGGVSTVPAGAQILIHPSRADLDFEIMKDTYIPANSVGKDIFGGYYQGRPTLNNDGDLSSNLFEVVGNLLAYCENNNATGCGQVLADLKKAHEVILTEADRIGGLENRVEMAKDVLSFQKLDQQERLSYTEDIDLTELLTKLTRQQLTYSTVLKSSSMIMQLSLANYI